MSKKFLDEDGLRYLVTQLINHIEQETQINIVTDIDDTSTNQQIPGAKAVYDFLTAALGDLSTVDFQKVDVLPATGEKGVIYLVETAPDSGVYSQNMYLDGQWINLGTMEIDLSEYWAKDDLEAMTNSEVQDIIDDVMGV